MQLSTKAEVHPDTHTRHSSLFELEIVKLKEEFGTYVFKLLPLIFNKTILLKKMQCTKALLTTSKVKRIDDKLQNIY